MLNIWVQGNYFFLQDTVAGKIHEAHAKDVKITKGTEGDSSFYIRNVLGWEKGNIPIPFTDIKKEGGVAWNDQTEFETFYRTETGKSNGGGNGGNGVASVTGFGVNNTDPLNPIMEDVNGTQIGINVTNIENNTTLANTKVASVTGYNVNNTDPKNPIMLDNYEAKWDEFSVGVSNVWTIVTLQGAPVNKNVTIIVEAFVNNVTVGVDLANGVLPRGLVLDNDSTASFTAKTNANGEIEVFTSVAGSTSFYFESINN